MNRLLIASLVALGSFCFGLNSAEAADVKAIASVVVEEAAQTQTPAYVIAILDNGKVVLKQTLGSADVASASAADENTVFGLASLTKTFTGMALLQLVDQGKINLQDPLGKYLDVCPTWRNLRICDLAGMRAGLRKSRGDEAPWPEESRIIQQEPLDYETGTKFVYSNPSFRVLGDVIAKVSGMPYLEYVRKNIFEPLGMSHSGTVVTARGAVATQYAAPGGQLRPIMPKNPMTSYSAGMLAASLDDLCLYAQAILDHKFLSEAAYRTYLIDRPPLTTGEAAPWAFGWSSTLSPKIGNKRMIAMNGGLPGVASTILLFPDQKIAVVALANLRNPAVYKVCRHAAFTYINGSDTQSEPEAAAAGD